MCQLILTKSVGIVDIPLAVLVKVHSALAVVLGDDILVVRQVGGHPVVEHGRLEAVGERVVVADDVVGELAPEFGIGLVVAPVPCGIED